jgi:hypothetical protein
MFLPGFVRICQLVKKFDGQHAHKEHGDLSLLACFKGRRREQLHLTLSCDIAVISFKFV